MDSFFNELSAPYLVVCSDEDREARIFVLEQSFTVKYGYWRLDTLHWFERSERLSLNKYEDDLSDGELDD
jgi:hypothetical protein